MDSCDVLIVGGGPAGSSCAWGLRSAGQRVLILDKSAFPRNKVCGGWITPQVLEGLRISEADYAAGRTFQPITGFRVGCMGQRGIDLTYDRPVSYGIRRSEFDEYLLRRSGAEVRDHVGIRSLERARDSWIVNGEIRARLLIGAGGHFCPVARHLGTVESSGNSRTDDDNIPVIAQEIEFEMDARQASLCAVVPEIPELYFCPDLVGYGWCFRKGNFLNLGLGRLDQRALPEHVTRFFDSLRAMGRIAFDPPSRPLGHAYLLWGRSGRRSVDDSVILIGDAAGLAYAQSGEGIRPAVESGLLAAQVILAAQGNYARNRLVPYAALLERRFSSGHGSGGTALAGRLPGALRNALARLLLRQKWFCRRVVVDTWFLHATVPALA
ncbi:MAG TPA: NAD(P)/FAD-dependent oxidoreductase [Terriglobales bacterium]